MANPTEVAQAAKYIIDRFGAQQEMEERVLHDPRLAFDPNANKKADDADNADDAGGLASGVRVRHGLMHTGQGGGGGKAGGLSLGYYYSIMVMIMIMQ